MSDNANPEPRFSHIPDYHLDESLSERLLTLVRFEQFLNEDDICEAMLDQLREIQELARENDETRIVIMSDLVLHQAKKYLYGRES